MRRILLMLTLIAILVAAVATPALAQSVCEWDYWDEGWWALVCYSPDLDSWWIADWWHD